MIQGFEFLQIQQLTFEYAKEILHDGIVRAVVLAAHALPDSFSPEHMLILPALIRMEAQLCSIWYSLKCLLQQGSYHAQYWPVRDGIADQITVVQIQNGREIHLLSKQTELGYISHPFLVWLFRIEVPVQQIRSNFSSFPL